MRKREHFIGLWLDDREYKHLLKQCSISGLNTSALIRHSVMGVELRPRPPDACAALLRELSAIGNNIHQLSAKANALNFIDAPALAKEAQRWHKFQADIEREFLRPEQSKLKWQ